MRHKNIEFYLATKALRKLIGLKHKKLVISSPRNQGCTKSPAPLLQALPGGTPGAADATRALINFVPRNKFFQILQPWLKLFRNVSFTSTRFLLYPSSFLTNSFSSLQFNLVNFSFHFYVFELGQTKEIIYKRRYNSSLSQKQIT